MLLITGAAAEKKKHVTETKEQKRNKAEKEYLVPKLVKIFVMTMMR